MENTENEESKEPEFPNFDPTQDLTLATNNRRMKRGLGAKALMVR